ncbi:MAG: hypothetical protein Q9200_004366 [Gallowayella weberi]
MPPMLPGRLRELGGVPSGSGSAVDLGGLVLKQAICIANEQLYRYESLVYSILGIIFLSTPHLSTTQIETLQATYNILKASGIKVAKSPAHYAAEESTIISNLAKRFESVCLRTPILSVYETKPTKIRGRGPFSGSKTQLV